MDEKPGLSVIVRPQSRPLVSELAEDESSKDEPKSESKLRKYGFTSRQPQQRVGSRVESRIKDKEGE